MLAGFAQTARMMRGETHSVPDELPDELRGVMPRLIALAGEHVVMNEGASALSGWKSVRGLGFVPDVVLPHARVVRAIPATEGVHVGNPGDAMAR
jgi:hypothetical protein